MRRGAKCRLSARGSVHFKRQTATHMHIRARTRTCEPRHRRATDARPRASSAGWSGAPADDRGASTSGGDDEETARLRTLGVALRRLNVQLRGAPWCEKCAQQKLLLSKLLPVHWKSHYIDCGSAHRCLSCVGCAQVPTWTVNGKKYPGLFDVATLPELVGLQSEGPRHQVEDRVIDAIDADDVLGGLKLGELPVGGRNRRTKRRSGWAKRAAIFLARREKGKFWCEFGELLTPRIAALAQQAARAGEALQPA
jgi:hypothetical protein